MTWHLSAFDPLRTSVEPISVNQGSRALSNSRYMTQHHHRESR
jgi:hypothetical protein